MNALIFLILFGQFEATYPTQDSDNNSKNLESTDVEIEKDGDDYLVTERPQIWNDANDSFGTQKRCEVDKRDPKHLTCYDMTIRR